MNIVKTFKTWMVGTGIATSGQVYISRVPSGINAAESVWWLRASGGGGGSHSATGESNQTKVISINYRSQDAEEVYQLLEELGDTIECSGCLELDGYEITEIPTIRGPFTDQDIDNEERTVGLLEAVITIKKEC